MNIREKNKLYYRILSTTPVNVHRGDNDNIKIHKVSWNYKTMTVDACRMFPFVFYAVVFNAATNQMEHFHGARAKKLYDYGNKHSR